MTKGRQGKKRQRKPEIQYATYIIEVTHWDWSFSFGINTGSSFLGPYFDHRHIELKGLILEPKELKYAVSFYMMPRQDLEEPYQPEEEPKAVGHINLQNHALRIYLSMPITALPPILHILTFRKPIYITISSERLRRNNALVWSYGISTKREDEDEEEEKPSNYRSATFNR